MYFKSLILSVFFIFLLQISWGQSTWNFGFKTGGIWSRVSLSSPKFNLSPTLTDFKPWFLAGSFVEYQFNSNISIQTEVLYSQSGFSWNNLVVKNFISQNFIDERAKEVFNYTILNEASKNLPASSNKSDFFNNPAKNSQYTEVLNKEAGNSNTLKLANQNKQTLIESFKKTEIATNYNKIEAITNFFSIPIILKYNIWDGIGIHTGTYISIGFSNSQKIENKQQNRSIKNKNEDFKYPSFNSLEKEIQKMYKDNYSNYKSIPTNANSYDKSIPSEDSRIFDTGLIAGIDYTLKETVMEGLFVEIRYTYALLPTINNFSSNNFENYVAPENLLQNFLLKNTQSIQLSLGYKF